MHRVQVRAPLEVAVAMSEAWIGPLSRLLAELTIEFGPPVEDDAIDRARIECAKLLPGPPTPHERKSAVDGDYCSCGFDGWPCEREGKATPWTCACGTTLVRCVCGDQRCLKCDPIREDDECWGEDDGS